MNCCSLKALAALLVSPLLCAAQPAAPARVDIPWNRYNDFPQTVEWMRRIEAAYPGLVKIETIGRSLQGRDMLVAVVNNPATGPDTDKPAMWIDGSIHGNEIQATEVVLYTLWYLTREHGHNERITALVDSHAFYLMPVVNPDGRQYWFENAGTPHSSRHNQRTIDHDRDGAAGEDGPDDLDGDGQITQMWKADPRGRWVRSQTDDRIFIQLRDDQSPAAGVPTYVHLGEEGTDNDADGRINEDPVFGDDMNRNWPADWQPEHVQGGAGPYPLSAPETRCIAEFMLARPNITAVQSYHNTGGMVLRGPGAAYRERMYPGEDLRVYDELARTGEQMLPYYRYLVIFSGLYRVHGGFVNWAAESLGAFSFTNELWTDARYFQRDQTDPNEEQRWAWRDRMAFGTLFTPYREHAHPQHGTVLLGGLNKWSSRVTPPFMLEEECHRNFAFTMHHADQSPKLEWARTSCVPAGGGDDLWRVRVEIANTRLMPTRSALRVRERIGLPDMLECLTGDAAARVVAANRLDNWNDLTPAPVGRSEPGRLLIDDGIPGRRSRVFEFFIESSRGRRITLRYTSQWARTIDTSIELTPLPPPPPPPPPQP